MKIKVLQWNIRGGFIYNANSTEDEKYNLNDLGYIENFIKMHNPDIVLLQEVLKIDGESQTEKLSKLLNLNFFTFDKFAENYLMENTDFGLGVISRFPIVNKTFSLFENPKLQTLGPDGSAWVTHDKGIVKCEIQVSDKDVLGVATTHLVPYRYFGVDIFDKNNLEMFGKISNDLKVNLEKYILAGDFNLDNNSLKPFFPDLFSDNLSEVILQNPTTPKGRFYDHVLYKGVKAIKQEIYPDVLTDHYPVITEFEI